MQKAFTYLSRSINSQEQQQEEAKAAEPHKAFVPPPAPLLHGFFSSMTSLFKAKTQSNLVRLPLGPSTLCDEESLKASIFQGSDTTFEAKDLKAKLEKHF